MTNIAYLLILALSVRKCACMCSSNSVATADGEAKRRNKKVVENKMFSLILRKLFQGRRWGGMGDEINV